MEKKGIHIVLLLLLGVAYFTSCDSSDVNTKRLGKQGVWSITKLEIGSNFNSALPVLDFESSTNPDEYTLGTWSHEDGTSATFHWRFNYFEGTFSLRFYEPYFEGDFNKAQLQCSNLSGDYNIETDKSKLFEFSGTKTEAYPGIRVFIQMVPQ